MIQTRRQFLATSAAAIGAVTILPFSARAADMFATDAGEVVIYPVRHASFVMDTPLGVIYADPVGDPALYADHPDADLILVTHEHGDHYNADTLAALTKDGTQLLTNPAVHGMLPADLQAKASMIANGESTAFGDIAIDAIPAYNMTEGRTQFHPQGRDNGYVLTLNGFRVYISGDTEDTPEMRALEDIDIAFLCMVVPFTMDAEAAASAVADFTPTFVYPYHYRVGDRDGNQDPREFARLVGDTAEVRLAPWYGET